MAERTPTDELGMPLPVWVDPYGHYRGRWDWNHMFNPSDHPLLRPPAGAGRYEQLGGRVVRHCRIEHIPRSEHKVLNEFQGPELPDNDHRRTAIVVAAFAGYRTNEAFDVRNPDRSRRPLSASEREWLYDERRIRPDRTGRLGRDGQYEEQRITGIYLASYALQYGLEGIEGPEIRQFLDEQTLPEVKYRLGMRILGEAVRVAVDPLAPIYREAFRNGHFPEGAPRHPYGVVEQVFGADKRPDYLGELHARLAA